MVGEIPRDVDVTDKGETRLAPERFRDAGEVRDVCKQMIEADKPRSSLRSQVDNIANGNPVYSLSTLKARGQGWRARTNYRGMEGKLQEVGNAFYDLNTEVNPCVRICLDYGKGQMQQDWCEKIAKHFTWLILNQWKSFDYHVPMRDSQMLRHGLGAHVWPIKGKWEPRTPRAGEILFPEDASVNFHTEGESFMLREFVPAHILYGYIRNGKNSRWNEEQVWKVLKNSSKVGRDKDSPEQFQKSIKNADYGTSATRQAGAWLNYYFIVEIENRKVSLYIIDEKGDATDYLFKERNRFDDFPLVIFPYEIPDTGTIHGIRGLGARTKEHFELLNRIYNAMADNVLISMYPQIKQNVQNIDPDKLKLMRMGALSIYPYGVEPSIMQFPPLGNGGLALTQEFQRSMATNNQTYLAGTPEPKDRETALSFSMRAQDSAKISKGGYNLYYRNLTRFYEKILPVALKKTASNEPWAVMAREMRKRILAEGVPEEAFNHIVEIEAKRSMGAGSAAARIQEMMQIFQTIYPVTSEDRKIAIERDLVSAISGYAATDRYARSYEDNDLPDQDDSFAVSENNDLAQGGEALAAPRQNHVRHLQRHLEKAKEIVDLVNRGEIDPVQALQIIQQIGQHMAQHLQQLEGNPTRKAEFDELHREWLALSSIADKLQSQVEEMQDAADEPSPEQLLSENSQIKMLQLQDDSRRKDVKLEQDESRKWRKQLVNERIQNRKATVDNQRRLQLADK